MRPRDVRKAIENALDAPINVQPLFLWGPPGVGKSAVPREICRERKINLIDYPDQSIGSDGPAGYSRRCGCHL